MTLLQYIEARLLSSAPRSTPVHPVLRITRYLLRLSASRGVGIFFSTLPFEDNFEGTTPNEASICVCNPPPNPRVDSLREGCVAIRGTVDCP